MLCYIFHYNLNYTRKKRYDFIRSILYIYISSIIILKNEAGLKKMIKKLV